jgi:hypothetical protein
MRIFSGGVRGRILATVSWMMVLSPQISRRCLGRRFLLRGQNLDPLPPAMMTVYITVK